MNKDAMTEKLKSGRYLPYEDFFALVRRLDEYECKSRSDEDKREIITMMDHVFTYPNDPLAAWLEDILATAQWREARVFPYEDSIYVRVEVKLLDANAEWRGPRPSNCPTCNSSQGSQPNGYANIRTTNAAVSTLQPYVVA